MESAASIPTQTPRCQATPLETLPSEIKVMILCHMPDVSSLRSIVHASPAYHHAYLGSRAEVLHTITRRILQSNNIGLLDPWTAIHAQTFGYHVRYRVDIITEYLESYARGRMDGNGRRLAPEDSLAILSLYRKFTVLIGKFCDANLVRNPLTGLQDHDAAPLTQSELCRLYRAFWRYEIYSRLFGPCHEATLPQNMAAYETNTPAATLTEVEMARNFFGLFPIHEVEEIACLHKYARDCYGISCNAENLIALGPKQLYNVLTANSENERDARIADGRQAGQVDVTMRETLDAYERIINWGTWQWKGLYDNFVSERVPSTGWLWASSRGIQNTDFQLRRWGYVFWDHERLDRWGITEENMVDWPDPRRSCETLRL